MCKYKSNKKNSFLACKHTFQRQNSAYTDIQTTFTNINASMKLIHYIWQADAPVN